MSDTDNSTLPPPANPPITREELVQKVARTIVARRLERDLTLEKVTQAIKIRIFYLQAIEKGKWEDLPGEVYVRGFIKRYAVYLGLDADALMAPYLKSQAPINDMGATPKTPQSPEVNRLQFLWIGVIFIFIVVFIKLIQKERTAPLSSVAPVATPVATSTSTPAASLPAAIPVLEKHAIAIYSPYPLWVRVAASNKTFEGFIPQASTWTWKGSGTFNVRMGHTKLVSMTFDGEPVPLTEDQRGVTLPNAH